MGIVLSYLTHLHLLQGHFQSGFSWSSASIFNLLIYQGDVKNAFVKHIRGGLHEASTMI